MSKARIKTQIKFFNSSINSKKTPKRLKNGLKRRVEVLQSLLRKRTKYG